MKLPIAAVLAILVARVLAPGADKPLKIPLVFGPLTLEGVCDFPIRFDVIGPQNQKMIIFSDGRQVINGQLACG